MKIIACIKQIPDTNDVKWSKDNNIIRDGLISVLNPCDLSAISHIREIEGASVTYLSMGPIGAVKTLEYALSLKDGEAYLLSDKKFGGADTLATAKTLAFAIKNYIKDFDLIVTGQFASDGDTAQTPYSLANILNIPHIGYVEKINEINENSITVTSIKEDGIFTIRAGYPVVISISKYEKPFYKPLSADYIRAQLKAVKILSAEDIGANPENIGAKGSPTVVARAFRPQKKRECKFINSADLPKELE